MNVRTLDSICKLVRGVTFEKSAARASPKDGFLPVLRAGNIQDQLDLENDLVWIPASLVSAQQLLKVGDIAICLSSGSARLVGKTASLRTPWRGTVGAFCAIVRPNADTSIDFMAHWFRSAAFLSWLQEQVRGANIQNLRLNQLAKIEIPLPRREDQLRIASRLGEQLALVERARAAADARLEAASNLMRALVQKAFDHQLGPVEEVPLGGLLTLRHEVIHPRDRPTGSAVFVGLEHVESDTGRRTGSVLVEKAALTGRKPVFRTGDIVYGYLRPYLNKVWVAEFDGLCSVDQYIFAVDQKRADTSYVSWFLRSPQFLRRAPIDAAPGQLPRIRGDEIASTTIPLPRLDEQKAFVGRLSDEIRAYDALIGASESELESVRHLPVALLRRAFRGEL